MRRRTGPGRGSRGTAGPGHLPTGPRQQDRRQREPSSHSRASSATCAAPAHDAAHPQHARRRRAARRRSTASLPAGSCEQELPRRGAHRRAEPDPEHRAAREQHRRRPRTRQRDRRRCGVARPGRRGRAATRSMTPASAAPGRVAQPPRHADAPAAGSRLPRSAVRRHRRRDRPRRRRPEAERRVRRPAPAAAASAAAGRDPAVSSPASTPDRGAAVRRVPPDSRAGPRRASCACSAAVAEHGDGRDREHRPGTAPTPSAAAPRPTPIAASRRPGRDGQMRPPRRPPPAAEAAARRTIRQNRPRRRARAQTPPPGTSPIRSAAAGAAGDPPRQRGTTTPATTREPSPVTAPARPAGRAAARPQGRSPRRRRPDRARGQVVAAPVQQPDLGDVRRPSRSRRSCTTRSTALGDQAGDRGRRQPGERAQGGEPRRDVGARSSRAGLRRCPRARC